MERGEIYFIRSTYQEEGSEQRADRPAVIVSNDKNNEFSDVVEIAYLTTKPRADLPTHMITRSALMPSTVLCEQITTVSKARVGELIGIMTAEEMKALDTCLAISLGIDFRNTGKDPVMREPTREELEKLAAEMKLGHAKIIPNETDLELYLCTKTERDLYKKFYDDLLEILKKGAKT